MFLLLPRLGLLAAPIGAIVGEALANYHFVVKDACNVLGEHYPQFAARLWAGVAAISCAAWGAGYFGHAIATGPAPLRWLEVGVLTTGAAALTACALAIRPNDRSHLVMWGSLRWGAFWSSTVKQLG
jgi:hypothetical protein